MTRLAPTSTSPAGRRSRGAIAAVATALAATLGSAPPAAAIAIQTGAVPIAAIAPVLPTACPQAADVDGTAARDLLRKQAKSRSSRPMFLDTVNTLLGAAQPVVAICDPPVAAAHRFIGPITGDAKAFGLIDTAWFGTRALMAIPKRQAPALVPGDHVDLPGVSESAQIDVAVSTPGGGARTVRISAAGARPVGLQITGTIAAPVVVVDRDGGEPTRIAVTPAPTTPLRFRVRVEDNRLSVRGQATPGTLVGVAAYQGPQKPPASDAAFTKETGRFSGLSTGRLSHRWDVAQVFQIDPIGHTRTVSFCRLRWASGNTLRAARCDENISSLYTPITAFGQREGTHESTELQQAAAAASARARRLTPIMTQAPPPLVTNPKTLVEATTTPLGQSAARAQFELVRGDLNRDGRPDAAMNSEHGDELLVSDGPAWKPVRIAGAGWQIATYPDLTGDGAAEIASAADFLITDAFAGPSLPAAINLRQSRPYSPGDLNLGLHLHAASPVSLLDMSELRGAVDDVTGDGRPELVVTGVGTFILSSSDVAPGHPGRFAQIAPITGTTYQYNRGRFRSADVFDAIVDDRDRTPAVVQPSGVTVARPADANKHPDTPRPIEVRTVDGSGATTATRTFTGSGIPRVLDVDPATGESLIALWEGCLGCHTRIARIGAAGEILSEVEPHVDLYALPTGSFIADGPDADDRPEVALWDYVAQDLSADPDTPTKAGTISILGSESRGRARAEDLPALGHAGKPLRALAEPSSVLLPNGTRWLAAGFQTSQNRKTIRQDNVLIQLAP